MKRLLLVATILIAGAPLFAQSSVQIQDLNGNNITNQTMDLWYDQTYATYSQDFNVKNVSGSTKSIMVRRHHVFMAGPNPYSTECFCWVICYAPSVYVSPSAQSMPSNSLHTFSSHIFHNGYFGNDTIIYNFYDSLNTGDSSRFTVVWHITPTAVKNLTPASGSISNIFPNPASTNATINYTLNNTDQAYLKVFDLLGNEIKRIPINSKEGTINISVADLKAGLYFCSIIADEKAICTQKLTIVK